MLYLQLVYVERQSAIGTLLFGADRTDAAGAYYVFVGADLEGQLAGVVEGKVADTALHIRVDVVGVAARLSQGHLTII